MMIEIIAGIGLGLWLSLAITVVAYMYARKNNLIEEKRDRFLRGDVDSAFERIEDLENELVRTQNMHTELSLLVTKRLGELYAAVSNATKDDTRLADKKED